jgi:Tol biopolymer transport system component
MVASVAVAGGETAVVPCECKNVSIFDLSPFRGEVLVGRPSSSHAGELWVVPLFKGPAKRIGDLKANAANWSADGRNLAYALRETLFVAKADGTAARKIAEITGQILWPRWSPDGKVIRFTENDYHNGEVLESIWEVGANGSNLRRLLDGWNNPRHECCGVWTPDGKFYIFQSAHDGRYDLWAISEERSFLGHESTSPVQLSSGLQGGYSFPVMGVNGQQIFAIGNQKQGELVRLDARLREFVPFLGGISATWVSYAKSGHSVAYIAYPDRTVWRANADGSNMSQLTFSPFEVDGLAWSPDEKWLALRAHIPGKPLLIYLMPAKGGDLQLLIPGEKEQGVPTWSADSKTIAFGDVSPVFDTTNGTDSIHVVDVEKRTLTEIPGSRGLWTVRWSPDGRFLAALTMVGQRLMLYDFQAKKWQPTKVEDVNNPTWSMDSQYVYFDTEGDNRTLRRIRVADGHVDELASLRAYPNLAWWWSGVAPDGSPLLLRNLDSHEIYALTLEQH